MWTDCLKNYSGDIYVNGTYIEDISKIRLDKLIGDNVIRLVPKPPKRTYDVELKRWMTIIDNTTRIFHNTYNRGIPAPSRYLIVEVQKQDSGGYYVKAKTTRSNTTWYGFIPYNAILRMEETK